MKSDKIFKEKIGKSSDFKFDAKVVNVFDDMVVRSVPFYLEIHRMITELSRDYALPGTNLYDLGCSTGTTFVSMNQYVDPSVTFIGIDESEEMLKSCRKNLDKNGLKRNVTLLYGNLNKEIKIENASVVILCLTLQFVRPIYRQQLVQSIYNQLNNNGILILVEKVLGESSEFNRQFIKYYYEFKRRNNYDDMEIAQKREALENILIPYKLSEDIEMLNQAGFKTCEVFFKWHNFAGLVAQK